MDNNYIQLDDWRVSYSVYGSGPALILLHGGSPGTSGDAYYSRNIVGLAKKFTLYVIDFPGWGKSSKNLLPIGQWVNPLEMGGEVISKFIDELSLERPHLLGSSFGASAALYHAIKKPEATGKIVLVSPGGGRMVGQPYSEPVVKLVTYYMGDGPTKTKFTSLNNTLTYNADVFTAEELERRFELSCDPEIIANPPLRMPTNSLAAPLLCDDRRLERLENDVLLLWGRQDQVQPLECMESFQGIRNKDVVIMNRCGHLPNMEYPERFNSLVTGFLS
ncbi:alpha/beta fold hydrolase [Pseudomonas vancouverensis]|uniref:alpha/beta fold hydrolase n=1 Tax=Pseudomonas vancouverensis TaxID=95300 RepID=UPI003CFCADBC